MYYVKKILPLNHTAQGSSSSGMGGASTNVLVYTLKNFDVIKHPNCPSSNNSGAMMQDHQGFPRSSHTLNVAPWTRA